MDMKGSERVNAQRLESIERYNRCLRRTAKIVRTG